MKFTNYVTLDEIALSAATNRNEASAQEVTETAITAYAPPSVIDAANKIVSELIS